MNDSNDIFLGYKDPAIEDPVIPPCDEMGVAVRVDKNIAFIAGLGFVLCIIVLVIMIFR